MEVFEILTNANYRNWPIGVNYDLLTGNDPVKTGEAEENIPWTLILHNKDYPKEYVLNLESIDSLWDNWLHQMKESCFVRDGNAKAVMNLSMDDTKQLLNGVKNRKYRTMNNDMEGKEWD